MTIIHTRWKKQKSKEQRLADWFTKLQTRLEKRKMKEATRKRPKPKVEYTHDDLSPELLAKLGLINTPSNSK